MGSFRDLVKKVNEQEKDKKTSSFRDLVNKVNDGTIQVESKLNGSQVNAWYSGVKNTGKSAYEYLSKEGYKAPNADAIKNIDTYLSQAGDIGQYLRANRNSFSNYEEMLQNYHDTVSYLRDLKDGIESSNKFYSDFKDEEDYNFWDEHSTVENRQEWYQGQQSKIDVLGEVYDNYHTIDLWYQDYQERPWAYTEEEAAEKLALYEKHKAYKQQYGSDKDILNAIDVAKAEMENYKRGNYNENGRFYGSKVVDDNYAVTQRDDFAITSANRDYDNATKEQLWDYDMSASAGSEALNNGGYFDEDGNIRDSKGNIVQNASAPVIEDKLGMFLQATEEEKTEAYNMISASNGNYNYTWGDLVQEGDQGSWKYLSDTELGIYYTYLGESQEKAYQFLSDMKTELNRRQTLDEIGQWHDGYEDANFLEKIAMNAATVPAKFVSNVAGFVEDTVNTVMGNEINPYSAAHSGMHYSQTVRGDTAEELDATGVKIPVLDFTLGDLYQTGMSRIDSALATKVFGGSGVALLFMGAAQDEAYKLYQQGASAEQITLDALAAGAAEAVWEYISFGKLEDLGRVKNPGQWVKNVLIQGWNEALEEAGTEVTNIITNALIMGSQSDLAELYKENKESAFRTFVGLVKQTLHSAVGGFAGGAMAGGVQGGASYIDTQKQYARVGETINDSVGGEEALRKLSKEVAGVSDAKLQKSLNKHIAAVEKNATNRNVGRLYDTLGEAYNAQNKADIVTILEMNKFSSETANTIADAVVALASGNLTEQQAGILELYKDNEHVQGVINSYDDDERSSIGKRNRAMHQFEYGVAFSAAAKKYAEKTFTPEGKYAVSTDGEAKALVTEEVDGKTITKDTGEIIDIKGVKEVRKTKVNGKTKVELILDIGDGKEINAENVSYANKNDALIYEAIANLGDNIDKDTANKLISKFDGGNAMVYARGITQAYTYGFYGLDRSEMKGKHTLSAELTEAQRNFAYGLGEKYRPVKDAKAKAEATVTKAPGEKGVYYRDKDGNATDIRTYLKETEIGLKDVQKTAVEVMEKMSEMLGVRFNVFESWVENGTRYYLDENGEVTEGNPNGFYDTATGEIYIDLNAGQDYQGTMLFTVAHELTHFMRQWSPEQFTKIAKIVFQHGGMKGSVAKLAAIKQQKAKAKGKPISYDTAIEEVVADGMETILKDGKILEFMEDVKKTDHEAWAKLKEWFQKLADFLKELVDAYRGHSAQTVEGAKVADFSEDLLTQIKQIWAEGALAGGQTYQMAIGNVKVSNDINIKEDSIDSSNIGISKQAKTGVKMQERTEFEAMPKQVFRVSTANGKAESNMLGTNKSVKELRDANFKENGFTQEEIDKVNGFIKEMADNMAKYRLKYKFVGLQNIHDAKIILNPMTGKIVLSAMVNNSDYSVNFDFTKICKKRVALQEVLETLASEKGKVADGKVTEVNLTPSNIKKINDILASYGVETACLCCFVESKRYNIQNYYQEKVVDVWNALVDEVAPDAGYFNFADSDVDTSKIPDSEFAELEMQMKEWAGKTGKAKNVEQKMREFLADSPAARKKLRFSDLVTANGRTNLHKLYPEIESLILSKLGQSAPKSVEAFTPYNGEIDLLEATSDGDIVKYLYSIAGVRSQSFSDFMIAHVFDVLQKTASMSARKMPAHVYTKEIARAMLFGMTGEKHNMSVLHNVDPDVDSWSAGLSKDGEYNFSDYEAYKKGYSEFVQSIGWKDAVTLQNTEGYSKDCGIIGVGFSYNHMLKLHNDPEVRQVIGYHTSQMPVEVKPLTHLDKAADYTDVQNTKAFVGFAKPNYEIPEGVPSYATPPQDVMPKGNKKKTPKTTAVSDTFDIVGTFNKLSKGKTGDARTAAAKETLRQLLEYANDHGYCIKVAPGEAGKGEFDLYGDVQKTENPYLTTDHYIEYCIERGMLPMFFEFSMNPNYYKDIFDFNVFDRKSYNPETGLHEDSDGRKAYAPQTAVHMLNEDGSLAFPENFFDIVDKQMNSYNSYMQGVNEKMPSIMDEVRAVTNSTTMMSDRDSVNGDTGIGVLHSDRDVTSWDIAWDDDNFSSLKSQMLAHQDEINEMSPVTDVIFDKSSGKSYAAILNDILRTKFGYKIERQDGAKFLFDETAIATIRHYVTTDEGAAAVIAAPYVLKRGKAISGHKNHKNRGYTSVTYGAPVTINGERVNVVVAVMFADKNRVHSFHVLMPDGTEFVLKKIKTDPEMEEATPKGGVPSPTGSVSNKKLSQPGKKVKKKSGRNAKMSDRDDAPIFYSQMSKVVDGMKQEKFGASSVISMLRGRGVKAEEIRWSGIQAFIEGKKSVTKQELLDFINSSMLHIEEQERGVTKKYSPEQQKRLNELEYEINAAWDEMWELWEQEFGEDIPIEFLTSTFVERRAKKIITNANAEAGTEISEDSKRIIQLARLIDIYNEEVENISYQAQTPETKWDQYKLDGGSNYRELVFTIPGATYTNMAMQGHWGVDAQGVIAHARIQDFDTTNGKMLFIEEIQSDWHNQGHKEGYRKEGEKTESMLRAESKKAYEEFYTTVEKMLEDNADWEDDNAIYYAHPVVVAEMFDGNESHFEALKFTDEQKETIRAMVAEESARQEALKTAPKQEMAPDAPFKETYHEFVLKRLLRMAAEEGYDSIGWTTAELQMERWNPDRQTNEMFGIPSKNPNTVAFEEGYSIEYDQDIPKFLKKYGKQWGATVGKTNIDTRGVTEWEQDMVEKGIIELVPHETEVWSMDITDSMKESVLTEGQPLFSDRDYVAYDRTAILKEETVARWLRAYATKSTPNYAQAYIAYMNPDQFLELTTSGYAAREYIESESYELDEEKFVKATSDQPLFLDIDHETGEVYGHEGRHRCVALQKAGIDSVPVLLFDTSNKYSKGDISSLLLKGQFNKYHREFVFDAIPLSYENQDRVVQNFATQSSSQRFWEKTGTKNTLRFQDRDDDSVSNRSLLANAFEGLAKTDTERNKIQEYRSKVALINEEEKKLRELNEQIKELSFAKGPRDNKKIKALRFDAAQAANRINTYDKQLLRLEASKPLQDVLNREKRRAYKKAEERGKEALADYKAKVEAKQKETTEEWRKSRKAAVAKARETAEKRDARAKLQKLVLDTVNWITYPAKTDVKCPDILKKPYADFLNGIDLSSKRQANGGDPTKNDLRLANAMSSLATALDKIMVSQDPTKDVDKVLDTGYLDLPADFVQKLRDMTESIKSMMVDGDYVVNAMTAAEVRKLSQMIRTLNHAIKTMSNLYANLRFANVEALGFDTMEFMDALGEIEKTGGMKDFVQWDNALPYYAFKRFGKGGESVFEGLMDAQDKLAYLAQEIFNFRDKTWTDNEANEWSKDTHTIDLPNGNTLTLTTADAMSIYCLSRREQGLKHLLGGGTRVMGIQEGSKKAKDSRSLLTIKDIDAINSSLTDRQKQVAEAIQEFMSTVCSDWGNEISMKRFLTKEFTEKFYFPIESNDENLPVKDPAAQQSDLFRLLNISATKPLTPGANNEVIIRNIFDVFTGHASDMARLNAYGMGLLDYMKWLNYREKSTTDEGQVTVRGVRKSMQQAYGDAAMSYVLNLVKDVNGRASDGGEPNILMKWMRAAKTASVGSSLRVATLQITSYPRAALVLSPKSLALGLSKMPQIEKAKKYCGVALWKSFGFYDTNISRSIEDQMKGVTDIKQKLIELSLKGAELGDAITWGALWNACEYEVAQTTKNKVGSEEFYQEVGKKLREVVYRTQVVDSTLTRSQIMRSKRGMAQEAAAFMSEPTLSANILMDAGFEFNAEKRRTGSAKTAWQNTSKYIGRAVAVYAIGQLTAALLEGFWDAWRDEDDEEFGKKYLDAFIENLLLDLAPFNKIPIVSDVFEAALAMFDVGFYSSDKMSTTWLTQAVSAVDTWKDALSDESSVTVYNGIYKTMRALSSFFGVSASGVMREGVALWNNTAGAYDPTLKILTYDRSKTDLGGMVLDAIIAGNVRQAESLKAKFDDEDEYESAVRKAIKDRYEAGEIDAATAEQYLVKFGGADKSDAYWKVEEWEYETDTGEDFQKYNNFYTAVQTGKNLKAVIKEYTDNGVDSKTLASQITSHFKPLYQKMSNAERAAIKGYLLNAYALLGYDRTKKSKDIDKWIED